MISSVRNIPKRYYVTALLFVFNIFEGYVLSNMSVIIVDITSDRKIVRDNVTEVIKEAEFHWTPMEKGFVLGMNAVGQIFGSIVCGLLVHRVGGATFLSIGKLSEAVISLTSPFVIDTNVRLFIGYRFVLGFFEGLSFVGCTDVLTRWIPRRRRVQMITVITTGYELGGVLTYPVAGFVLQHFGWRTVFYTCGTTMFVCSIIWILSVSKDPWTDRFISEKEKFYLSREIDHVSRQEVVSVPYKSILTSIPVYAMLNEIFCASFVWSFHCFFLPFYVKDSIDTDIQTIGLLSGIPPFCGLILRPGAAIILDYLRSKPGGCSPNRMHKILTLCAQSFTITCFFVMAIWNSVIVSAICITLAKLSGTFCLISENVLEVDVGGQYAGLLKSMTQVVRSGTGFLNPFLIGLLIRNHTQSEWNAYFFAIGFITMYGVIVFVIFGSGDLQPWAKAPPRTNTDEHRKDDLCVREQVHNCIR